MTGRLAFGEPIEAVARDGIVCIFTDAATARDIAAAWEHTYAAGGLDTARRPTYRLDVAALKRAAGDADLQSGTAVRYVPLLKPGSPRLLSLVGGEG